MEIKTFRLTSGEELIAELVDDQNGCLHVKNPLRIQLAQNAQGQVQLGFAEWPEFADPDQLDPVRIPHSALACFPLKPYSQLETQYESTVTGIVLPPTPKILVE
jgi:hypothetical protein